MKVSKIKVNGQDINLGQLVIIVGPNRSGKTKLIDDLYAKLVAQGGHQYLWNDIEVAVESSDADYKLWRDNLRIFLSDKNRDTYQYACPYSSNSKRLEVDQYELIKSEDNKIKDYINESTLANELTHFLDVNLRTNVNGEESVPGPDQEGNSPSPLNLLYKNPDLLRKLNGIVKKIIYKKIFLANHNYPNLEMYLLDIDEEEPKKTSIHFTHQDSEKLRNWKRVNKVVNLSRESHGIRALLKILLTYILPTNKILVLDEPEVHLYPYAKRNLGKALAGLANNNDKQIICVTHDSSLLEGVFSVANGITIIKAVRKKNLFRLKNITFSENERLRANQRQKDFLNIPFWDFTIIVEGTNDKVIYEFALDKIYKDEKIEYGVVNNHGCDTVNSPEWVAKKFESPYLIILDFDVLNTVDKDDHLTNLRKIHCVNENNEWLEKAEEISKDLRIGQHKLSRQDFKIRGIEAIQDINLKQSVEKLVNDAKEFGLFIVPSGDIESLMYRRPTDSDKNKFPDIFMNSYEHRPGLYPKLNDFLNSVVTYIKAKISG